MAPTRGILIGKSLPATLPFSFIQIITTNRILSQSYLAAVKSDIKVLSFTSKNGGNERSQSRSSKSACILGLGCDLGSRILMPLKYSEELRLSLHRLNLLPNYANITLFERFDSFGGVGLKALRDIPFGTPIISEPALFSKPKGRDVTQTQARIRSFQELFCPFPSDTANERFEANSFAMDKDRQDRRWHGIFIEASRFNHSCVPNAYFSWNSNSQRLTVHAIEDIPEGGEIFVNYRAKDYDKTRDKRQEALSATYNFVCTCSACDQRPTPLNFGSKSEERRRQIHELQDFIDDKRNSRQTQVRRRVLDSIQASIELLDQVGLIYPQLADMYSEAAWYYEIEVQRATRAEHSR